MKPDIHPEYKDTQVTCGCGEKFVTRSTVASGSIYVEVCSVCHPFYTGKQRILDTGGRVAKFEERFGKKEALAFLKNRIAALVGLRSRFFYFPRFNSVLITR